MQTQETRPLLYDHSPRHSFFDGIVPRYRKLACGLILTSLTLERIAFIAFVSNLFLFLNTGSRVNGYVWGDTEAITAVYLMNGVTFLFAPIVGWISDEWTGRYYAILVGLFMNIVGFGLLTGLSLHRLPLSLCDMNSTSNLTALPTSSSVRDLTPCSPVVYTIIILISLGTSFTRVSFPYFGAEQVSSQ